VSASPQRPGLRALVALAAVAALVAAPRSTAAQTAQPAGAGFACDRSTVFTLAGLDTSSGTAMFAAAGEAGWLIEVAGGTAGATARASSPTGPRVFGGSVGPGPLFGVSSCGDACLQAARWRSGEWEPFGEPLRAPVVSTVHATYDLEGKPWLVLRSQTGAGGGSGVERTRAWGFRYDGREWASRGALEVAATGALGAVPDPAHPDAVLAGSGRFSASGQPETWLRGVPSLPEERRGEAVPAAGGVVYLDADGQVYLGGTSGESWERSTWTPWGAQRGQLLRPGHDYSVDLPLGDRRGSLALAWFDRRAAGSGEGTRLALTTWAPGVGWRPIADLAPEVVTLDQVHLPFEHLVVTRPGSWLLLSGCARTAAGSGLVLRTYRDGTLSPPQFVPLR
jgi:hypothetical protein